MKDAEKQEEEKNPSIANPHWEDAVGNYPIVGDDFKIWFYLQHNKMKKKVELRDSLNTTGNSLETSPYGSLREQFPRMLNSSVLANCQIGELLKKLFRNEVRNDNR